MNIIADMNTAQLYVDPEMGEDTRNSELPTETLPKTQLQSKTETNQAEHQIWHV